MENRNAENASLMAQETYLFTTVAKVLITVLFVIPLVHYSIYKEVEPQPEATEIVNNTVPVNNDSANSEDDLVRRARRTFVKQPSCPISHLQVIFSEICNELFIKKETCTPDDVNNEEKHKVPKVAARNRSGNHEPRGTIVGYLAGGLLLTSLGAAIVELYKAKSQPNTTAKNKPPFNRKCSLADLTVLKHNRKELARRDSILELPEDGNAASKQLGFRPSLLHRRCSFPVGPSYGIQYGIDMSMGVPSCSTLSIRDSRKSSICTESRRLSTVDGSSSRRVSMDCSVSTSSGVGRRISVGNDSPERTRHHWTRILHRH